MKSDPVSIRNGCSLNLHSRAPLTYKLSPAIMATKALYKLLYCCIYVAMIWEDPEKAELEILCGMEILEG